MCIWHLSWFCIFQVIIRCLPPTLTEDELKQVLGPLPDNDYVNFVRADKRLVAPHLSSEHNLKQDYNRNPPIYTKNAETSEILALPWLSTWMNDNLLKPYENYLPIGQNEYSIIYWANCREYKKKIVSCASLWWLIFRSFS